MEKIIINNVYKLIMINFKNNSSKVFIIILNIK